MTIKVSPDNNTLSCLPHGWGIFMATACSILLEGRVHFCSKKRCLSYNNKTLSLSENESRLLVLLSDGEVHHKNEIIDKIWVERGIVVTDSSYYKLIRQLRNSLVNFDIPMSTIKTLTRAGICYIGSISISENNESNHRDIISIKPLVIGKPQKILFNNLPMKTFFSLLLISLFVVALTGCANISSPSTKAAASKNALQTSHYKILLVADNKKIPTDSFITITVSKNKTINDSFEQTVLTEFSLKTTGDHTTYSLSLPLERNIIVLGKVNISVRIENNGIPIMTSVVKEIDLIKSKGLRLHLVSA